MSEHNITVEGGKSVRLKTEGKYCDRDIIVTATGGGGGGGADMEDMFVGGNGTESITEYSNERVNAIRNYTFAAFTGLKTVNLPNVETIGDSAFNGCSSLTEIDFPKCTSVGANSFQICRAIKRVNLPVLQTVGSYAFSNDSGITEVNAPLVTTIARQGFYLCTILAKLDFHQLNTIALYSFTNSGKLETLIIRTATVCALENLNALTGTAIANKKGYIYVPSALVEEYKAATNWSTYADQFRAIEDYPEITGAM